LANVALNRPVSEDTVNGAEITDGVTLGYTAYRGFGWFRWPGSTTLDLGEEINLKGVRFLLWDDLGDPSHRRAARQYGYRLLVSRDKLNWRILYDTSNRGRNGWQGFPIINGLPVRYVRIHGLYNTANGEFHIVQLEAYDEELPRNDVQYDHLTSLIPDDTCQFEMGEGSDMTSELMETIGTLENMIDGATGLDAAHFRRVFDKMKVRVHDLSAIADNMGSVRREIIDPVQMNLKSLLKSAKWSSWVGVAGGLIAIISILITLFK